MPNRTHQISFQSVGKFRKFIFNNLERKNSTRYHYPRSHLEQPYYTNPGTGKVTLHLSMLGDTTQFVSPLMALLNQLRSDGFDVTAPFDEAVAMRSVLQQAYRDIEAMSTLAIKARFKSANKESNHD